MSDLVKERVLVILALLLCLAVSLLGAWDAPELSPIGVVYSDTENLSDIVTESSKLETTAVITATGKIPAQKDSTESQSTTVTSTQSDTQIININTATKEQLVTLKGIGDAYAQRIIEYRDTHGGFDSVEEIMNVSGIGEKRFAEIKDRITVD